MGQPVIEPSRIVERPAFHLMRHWRWSGIVAALFWIAASLAGFIALATFLGKDDPIRAGYAGFLMTIPPIFGPLWQVAYIEQRTAPVWLMRAALAVANDDERAYIYTMMTELALSKWRNEPITCGTLPPSSIDWLALAQPCASQFAKVVFSVPSGRHPSTLPAQKASPAARSDISK